MVAHRAEALLLMRSGDRWCQRAMDRPVPSAGQKVVAVEAILIPPLSAAHAIFVGRPVETPEQRVVGWGVAANLVTASATALKTVPSHFTPDEALLAFPAAALDAALTTLTGGSTTCAIVGAGPLAILTRKLLARRDLRDTSLAHGAIDLLVDVTGNPTRWGEQLAFVRDEGRLLLFVPPWAEPVDFNFYPEIHRRSLRVVAARWHCLPPQDMTTLLGLQDVLGEARADLVALDRSFEISRDHENRWAVYSWW